MKFLIVLLATFATINALSDDGALWLNFKAKHSKLYSNHVEDLARFKIFQDNLKRIEEHNARFLRGEVSYSFGITKFADLTADEFKALMNKQIASKPKFNTTRFVPDENVQDAASRDWRNSAVLAVKDQGECGSCWAFSATGALEGQLAINKNQRTPLSEQELVDCATDNYACYGGFMGVAFDYIKTHGITSEDNYPYKGVAQSCKTGTTRVVESISGFKEIENSELALKKAVSSVGPISVAVYADNDWQLYTSGVYSDMFCPGGDLKNHGVLVVGYGTEGFKDYWIIKNSWGSDWGEDGYIRVIRGYNACGISEDASFPLL